MVSPIGATFRKATTNEAARLDAAYGVGGLFRMIMASIARPAKAWNADAYRAGLTRAAGALREDVDRLARPPSDADEARIMRRFRKYLLEKNPEIADVEELDPEKWSLCPERAS